MILTPENIKTAREKKQLSKQDLADLIGVSEKSIQFYENGERVPKHDKVVKLINVLDIDISTNVPEKQKINEVKPLPFI